MLISETFNFGTNKPLFPKLKVISQIVSQPVSTDKPSYSSTSEIP